MRGDHRNTRNKLNKTNLFKLTAAFICIFIMLFSVFTIVKASSYSVLADDDFWHCYDVGVFHTGFMSYFIASLKYAKHTYLSWQGTLYFSMFFAGFPKPHEQLWHASASRCYDF